MKACLALTFRTLMHLFTQSTCCETSPIIIYDVIMTVPFYVVVGRPVGSIKSSSYYCPNVHNVPAHTSYEPRAFGMFNVLIDPLLDG